MPVTLPEFLLPSILPPCLANAHDVELIDIYADLPWRTGHDTKRRVYTIAPRIVDVQYDLDQPQMTAFTEWFEGPSRKGTEYFAVQLANFGPGLRWFRARFFTSTYTARPDQTSLRWNVKFKLYILGEGTLVGPVTTTFESTRRLALVAEPLDTGLTQEFSSTRSLALEPLDASFGSTRVLRLGTPTNYVLQDGELFYVLQEDGSYIEIEEPMV